ncbi:unnamed protein product [Danaus chrysippus]|uniref:(African queen) hypothetical protein n=1 Tax=Danaus chrysippus TaxID=151541 RepID=A0A8J2RB08_9NEOP|nr:unnamed protein product [Danaus chrysippus]
MRNAVTVVTRADGIKFIEGSDEVLAETSNGFVVDTKPDDVPILIIDYLYIGSQDCAVETVVEAYNIKHVVSLGVNVNVANVDQIYIPVLDLPDSDIKLVLSECLPYIRKCLLMMQNVLVHCNAGVSRTAVVAIAYLMHYELMSYKDAYDLVKQKRPAIQPNTGFKKQLQDMTPGKLI